MNDSDTQIDRPKQLKEKLSLMANAIQVTEGTTLSSSVFCLLLFHYQIPHTRHLLKIFISFPCTSKRLDLLNIGASSVGVNNCQCSSEEGHIKQKPSTCLKARRVFQPLSIIRWDRDMFRQPEPISIRRSRSTYLSLSQSDPPSHKVIR